MSKNIEINMFNYFNLNEKIYCFKYCIGCSGQDGRIEHIQLRLPLTGDAEIT